MAQAALDIAQLSVSYGTVEVLKRLSLQVAEGEFVALLGASGCGKTTLLRSIAGFVMPQAGRIAVFGRDLTGTPPEKRDMAMVFQSYALWPHMSVARNIAYGLKLRRLPREEIEARVARVLAMVKLGGFGERNVTQLSGGQRQRVALARALAVDPRILLLDEPLSNLDARIREELRHEIKAMQKKIGITTIHVTHDREEAMIMADRVVIMDAGLIAQAGAPEEIYRKPASPFVAAFMGATNVVRLDARMDDGMLRIAAGPDNSAIDIPGNMLARKFADGRVVGHFRSGEARLDDPSAASHDRLVLKGRVTQASYPGGTYRYAVAVGDCEYIVDEARRIAVGQAVGIALPLSALYLFPDDSHPPATVRR